MKIFGQVLDVDDLPIALANISSESKNDTDIINQQTDLDGNFLFEDDSITPESEFKISYIGYTSQFLKARNLQGKKIKLIDEVQDTGNVFVNTGTRPKNYKSGSTTNKSKFISHLQDHKLIYAGIGALTGIVLIVRAFKK